MATFEFPDIEPGILKNIDKCQTTVSDIMRKVDVYDRKKHLIIKTSKPPQVTNSQSIFKQIFSSTPSSRSLKSISCSNKNGLVSALLTAYNEHIPICIRPDDIWIAIMVAFGKYVDANSEQMEKYFVTSAKYEEITRLEEENPKLRELGGSDIGRASFKVTPWSDEKKEKKKINVRVFEKELPTFNSSITDIHKFVSKFTNGIREQSNPDIIDWFLPDFTTTTAEDRMVSNLVLMGTVKKYFEYGCGAVACCGLNKVTLEGTLEDWQKLRSKVNKLLEFDSETLVNWSNILGHVLDHFIRGYQGNPDPEFWQQVYSYAVGGSGIEYKVVSGWVLAFAPFSGSGKNILNNYEHVIETAEYGWVKSNNICDCGIDATINVTVIDKYTEQELDKFKYLFYSGLLLPKYDHMKNEMRASVDWCIIKEDPEAATESIREDPMSEAARGFFRYN